MYTKSKTKVEDQQNEFKKKVMAQKPTVKNGSKSTLTNIQPISDPKDLKAGDKDKKKGVSDEKNNNQLGGGDAKNQQNKPRAGSIEKKNVKEKKKRIVYVDENSDDPDEEIVIVKKKRDKHGSLEDKNRNKSIDDKTKGKGNSLGNVNSPNGILLKNEKDKVQMRTRSQPPIPIIKPKKKVEEKKLEPKKDKDPYILVTEFYLGQYKAPICGADIFEMFNWKGQYAHLDINHAYFHWLFPHFQGPHGKVRATLFRQNAVIGKRIIESYRLILDFYGIQLDDEVSGAVSRTDQYLTRYKETFLRPYTNHEFRVKRMLQFLNVTGYRIYAIQLVKFFENEIFKVSKNSYPPLKSLESIFQIEWKPYGEVDERDKKALDSVAQKCLFSYDVLTQEINSHLKTII